MTRRGGDCISPHTLNCLFGYNILGLLLLKFTSHVIVADIRPSQVGSHDSDKAREQFPVLESGCPCLVALKQNQLPWVWTKADHGTV